RLSSTRAGVGPLCDEGCRPLPERESETGERRREPQPITHLNQWRDNECRKSQYWLSTGTTVPDGEFAAACQLGADQAAFVPLNSGSASHRRVAAASAG